MDSLTVKSRKSISEHLVVEVWLIEGGCGMTLGDYRVGLFPAPVDTGDVRNCLPQFDADRLAEGIQWAQEEIARLALASVKVSRQRFLQLYGNRQSNN